MRHSGQNSFSWDDFPSGLDEPFFLILIIAIIHLEFVKQRVLPLGSTCWTFTMYERLFLLFLLKHGPFIIINDAR
jgi:hypothetical protein